VLLGSLFPVKLQQTADFTDLLGLSLVEALKDFSTEAGWGRGLPL